MISKHTMVKLIYGRSIFGKYVNHVLNVNFVKLKCVMVYMYFNVWFCLYYPYFKFTACVKADDVIIIVVFLNYCQWINWLSNDLSSSSRLCKFIPCLYSQKLCYNHKQKNYLYCENYSRTKRTYRKRKSIYQM